MVRPSQHDANTDSHPARTGAAVFALAALLLTALLVWAAGTLVEQFGAPVAFPPNPARFHGTELASLIDQPATPGIGAWVRHRPPIPRPMAAQRSASCGLTLGEKSLTLLDSCDNGHPLP